jgi:branched-chain amino acid transport system permease protein
VPFGGAVAACLAALVAIPFFRWRGDVFAFGTLAFAETLRMIVGGWSDVGGSVGLTITCVQLDVSSNYYLTLFSAIAVMLLLVFLVDSRFGRALTTIRNDELVANSVGIPVLEYKSLALVASSFMAGTAGSLYALNILFVSPALFGVTWTASSILIAIVGGTATIFGPVLMAFVYVFLQVYFLASFPTLNQVLYGSLLIAMILILPRGLTGLWHRFAGSFKG